MQFEQAYQAEVEITLKVWDDEIDRLVEKREKAEARIGYSCLIAVLHSKRDEIRTDLGRLYKAQVEQWNRQGNNANSQRRQSRIISGSKCRYLKSLGRRLVDLVGMSKAPGTEDNRQQALLYQTYTVVATQPGPEVSELGAQRFP